MIGAIYTISQAPDPEWSTSLIVLYPWITIWLDELQCNAEIREQVDMQRLSCSDRTRVLLNSRLAIRAGKLIRAEVSEGKTTKSLYLNSRV